MLAEALLIGIVGGIIGMLISYFAFNGMRASTMNFSTFSQITFAFTVTPADARAGLVYALALGIRRRPAAEPARRAPADHDGVAGAVGRASARREVSG